MKQFHVISIVFLFLFAQILPATSLHSYRHGNYRQAVLPPQRTRATVFSVRGGGGAGGHETRRKKKKTRKKSSLKREIKTSNEISEKIRDDPAKMMGDAIRARSAELLQDDLTMTRDANGGGGGRGGTMFTSLSYAIGTSDQLHHEEEGGGVEPPASAVIANYFLKSHGGVHGVQSITSLLSILFGFGTYLTPKTNLGLKSRLMQRSLICAFAKHLSGFLGAATISAGSIPDIGWKRTRMAIENLALDPVAQYLFYCALLIVWSNNNTNKSIVKGDIMSALSFPWWLKDDKWRPLCLTCILTPILLREVVNTIWVLSDVMVLYHSAKSPDSSPAVLNTGKALLDVLMSLLVTPQVWRHANGAQRQRILAKLVGKVSLGFEVGMCLLLLYDAMRAFVDFSIAPMASRPSLLSVAKRILCARLMVNFILVRRRKVLDLVTDIRGGAMRFPDKVLDCLLEPSKAMGLDQYDTKEKRHEPKTWLDWAIFLLGF